MILIFLKLRGVDGGIIICDELEFINHNIINKCILPLYIVDNVCFIGITTPSGKREGFCSRIMNAKNEYGENPFTVVYIKTVCDNCIGTEKENNCKHVYSEPRFHNEDKKKDISLLYDRSDNTGKIEMMAITNNDSGRAFSKELLSNFEEKRVEMITSVNCVFIGIDTSGISSSSETSIVSLYYQGMNMIVCGIDSQVCKTEIISNELIKTHIRGIISLFGKSINIVVIPEIYAKNASMIANSLNEFDNVFIPFQKFQNDYNAGVMTTNNTKQEGVLITKFALTSDAINICNTIITSCWMNKEMCGEKMSDNICRLVSQMSNFGEIVQSNKQMKQTVIYSGKKNGDGKDDMVMALIICVYWSRMIKLKNVALRSSKKLNQNMINKFN